MNVKLLFCPFACIYLMLVSATTIKVQPKADTTIATEQSYPSTNFLKFKKTNFIERWIIKTFTKKYNNEEDVAKADKQAKSALIWGTIAIVSLAIGLYTLYPLLLCLPASIVAMVLGKSAIRRQTNLMRKAKTAYSFGLVSFIGCLVGFLLAAVIFATYFSLFK